MAKVKLLRTDEFLGYMAAIGCILSSGFSAASVQALQGAVPDFELSAARGLMQGVTFLFIAMLKRMNLKVHKTFIPALIYLSLLYIFYNIGLFGSTVYIPLVETIGLIAIFSTAGSYLQANILFGKSISKIDIIALTLSIIGIILVMQPPFLFSQENTTTSSCSILTQRQNNSIVTQNSLLCHLNHNGNNTVTTIELNRSTGYLLAILGGVGVGLTWDINAILLHDLHPVCKVTYSGGLYAVLSILISIYIEPINIALSLTQVLYVVGHCVASTINIFGAVYAAHMLGGIRFGLVNTLQVLVFLFLQYTLMKDIMPGYMNWIEVLGSGILVFGAAIKPGLEIIQAKREVNSLP